MKVFDVIPKGFFSILSGKNRDIYSEMILVVRQEYKRSTHVDKNILLDQMVDRLSELNLLMDVEAKAVEMSEFLQFSKLIQAMLETGLRLEQEAFLLEKIEG